METTEATTRSGNNSAWTGTLRAIYVAPEAGAPMHSVETATALEGKGLDGDRYADGAGSFSRWPGAGRALTLIATESLDEAEREFGVALADGEHRRNLVVSSVPLDELLGVTFRVGDVLLRGARLCAPCAYLVRVTGQPEIFNALVRRGGLRAEILSGGTLRVGDQIKIVGDPTPRRPLPG